MILKKILLEDGKVTYEEISFKDALNYENKNDLVFTSEDEKEEFFDQVVEDKEEVEDICKEETKNTKNSDEEHTDSFGFFNQFINKPKSNSKSSKLLALLPFMDNNDIKEIVNEILAGNENYKDIKLPAMFPFLDTEDCDALFMKFINAGDNIKRIETLAPFVSKSCLSKVVDDYIAGKYDKNIKMTMLYPFMDNKDIKKLSIYYINKKEE